MKPIKKYNDILILCILWFFSIYSIIILLTNQFPIPFKNYIGFFLLLAITIMKLKNIPKARTTLVVMLLLGAANLIQFTYWEEFFNFRINPGEDSPTVGLQPLSFFLLLLFTVLNFYDILKFIFRDKKKSSAN